MYNNKTCLEANKTSREFTSTVCPYMGIQPEQGVPNNFSSRAVILLACMVHNYKTWHAHRKATKTILLTPGRWTRK